VLCSDDGVVKSPICGVLQALRCSMYAYTRPRQQGSQTIRIWNFRPTPSSSHTAALSYPAESADIASELSIGLHFAEKIDKIQLLSLCCLQIQYPLTYGCKLFIIGQICRIVQQAPLKLFVYFGCHAVFYCRADKEYLWLRLQFLEAGSYPAQC
jgi:hypothetical protein